MRISDWSSDVCSSDLRGYDPGAVIGDSGVAVALEARYGSLIPANRDSFAIQPFAFLAAAAVRNKDSTFAGLNPQRPYSAGGGLRIAWGNAPRLDVTPAAPLPPPDLLARRPRPPPLVTPPTHTRV